MDDILTNIAFSEPERASAILEKLFESEVRGLRENVLVALSRVPCPDVALDRIERFLDSCLSARSERELMAGSPTYTELLLAIFAQSQHLTDILTRNPEYASWLWSESSLHEPPSREELVQDVTFEVRKADGLDARHAAMRRIKRRETLRIGARDVFVHAPAASIAEDLSNLADAMIEASLMAASEHLQSRHGAPRHEDGSEASATVLAMGKLGGSELNFSSDIDLVFIYSDEGQTSGGAGQSLSNSEYFHRLGELLIKGLSAITNEGYVFRVDMRLRPHGKRGPLAVSLDHARDYYERTSQAWERQALIKARTAAGDAILGERFLDHVRPLVYQRFFDDDSLEDIREMKRQIEALIESKGQSNTEVKLGRGGIRDIEFTVQLLQLLNGGRIPDLQTGNTLAAIAVLERHGILRHFEAGTLVSNYNFLRHVEHRLQIEGSQQLHALPTTAPALDAFAARLGYTSGESFMADYSSRADATRDILERFLEAKGSGNLWISDLLNTLSDGQASIPRLTELGFEDGRAAREELLLLSNGSEDRPHSAHIRQQFAAIVPTLLSALSHTPEPDATLLRLGQILGNLRAPGAIYDILRWNPNLCDYLATLVANSRLLAEILIRDPGLFETFGHTGVLETPVTKAQLAQTLRDLESAYVSDAAIYRFHDGESLRVGLRDLVVGIDVFEVGCELTLIADACIEYALGKARVFVEERFKAIAGGFAILGLGKLGGCELGYGSDLDLVFVYDLETQLGHGVDASHFYSSMAAHVIRILKEPSRFGLLYDIDARLRPDGKKGVLAVSNSRLKEYYAEDAEAWERLALMKVRAIAGDQPFLGRVEVEIREIAFGKPLTYEDLDRVEEIRKRIVENALPLDIKKGQGGIAEIEFAVRLLQLRYASNNAKLIRADVIGALSALQEAGVLDADSASVLKEAYGVFRRVENRIRMMDGRSCSSLPNEPKEQQHLAKRLEMDANLINVIETHKQRVHGVYEGILNRTLALRSQL